MRCERTMIVSGAGPTRAWVSMAVGTVAGSVVIDPGRASRAEVDLALAMGENPLISDRGLGAAANEAYLCDAERRRQSTRASNDVSSPSRLSIWPIFLL